MPLFDRITSDPERLGGEPCVRDLRLTVRRVVAAVALYPDREELRREYPELDDEDIRQALEFAAACVHDQRVLRPLDDPAEVPPRISLQTALRPL